MQVWIRDLKQMTNNFQTLKEIPGWFRDSGKDEDVVLSTRVRVSRNLTGFPFPSKIKIEDEERVKNIIIEAFESLGNKTDISYRESSGTLERRMLSERNLISQEFSLDKHKTFLLSSDQKLVCMINSQDHMNLAAYSSGMSLDKTYNVINSIESDLEKLLDFSVSLEFGYLNGNIQNSGTGMKVSLLFHLPALVHLSLFDRAIKSSMDKDFVLKGYMGEDNGSLGDLYQISNGLSIGLEEREYIGILLDTAGKLVKYERQAREELRVKRKIELEDKYYRSVGLLRYCRKLSSAEAVKALSDIRLGIVLGWSDLNIRTVDSLLFLTQKAHIQKTIGSQNKDSLLIDSVRAGLIRHFLGFQD